MSIGECLCSARDDECLGPQIEVRGNRMSDVGLSNDDRCAVDLMLERNESVTQGINNCFTVAPSANMQQRLTRVEKLLHLLDAHPTSDPAHDLVARTLARCDERAAIAGTGAPSAHPVVTTATR